MLLISQTFCSLQPCKALLDVTLWCLYSFLFLFWDILPLFSQVASFFHVWDGWGLSRWFPTPFPGRSKEFETFVHPSLSQLLTGLDGVWAHIQWWSCGWASSGVLIPCESGWVSCHWASNDWFDPSKEVVVNAMSLGKLFQALLPALLDLETLLWCDLFLVTDAALQHYLPGLLLHWKPCWSSVLSTFSFQGLLPCGLSVNHLAPLPSLTQRVLFILNFHCRLGNLAQGSPFGVYSLLLTVSSDCHQVFPGLSATLSLQSLISTEVQYVYYD